MIDARRRIDKERSVLNRAQKKSSKPSAASTTFSTERALQAKARQAELEARNAQLDMLKMRGKKQRGQSKEKNLQLPLLLAKSTMGSFIPALMTLALPQSATIGSRRRCD